MTVRNDPIQIVSFDNLAQRVLYRYAFTFADFVPIESAAASVDAQRAFYEFGKSLIHTIADEPSVLGMSTDHPDEWLGPHETLNMRPELYKVRNACQKAFADLCSLLYSAGLHGDIAGGRLTVNLSNTPKLTAKTLAVFAKLWERHGMLMETRDGVLSFYCPKNPEIFPAWRLLAATCGKLQNRQAIRFMLWMHHDDGAYFLERIQALLGLDGGFFGCVAEKYQARGYRVQFGIDDYKTKYLYTKDIGGLSIEYATLMPTVRFVNNTCVGVKAVLEHADELGDNIKEQLIRFCKPCGDCMICTKGGKNKQFAVAVHHGGSTYRLCPEFVQMEWYNGDISTEKIDFMLSLNELQEQYGTNWRKTPAK